MQVALWYSGIMLLMLAALWVQERWKTWTWVWNVGLHLVGVVWIAMMRHTGNPVYTHKARRYR